MPGDPSSPQPPGRETTPRLNELIGLGPIDARNGRATCEVRPAAGAAGATTFALTTAVDMALVRAAGSTVAPPEEMNGTAELNVTYLRPSSGPARIEAEVVGRSPTLRLVEFSVLDRDGIVARGRSSYAIRPGSRS